MTQTPPKTDPPQKTNRSDSETKSLRSGERSSASNHLHSGSPNPVMTLDVQKIELQDSTTSEVVTPPPKPAISLRRQLLLAILPALLVPMAFAGILGYKVIQKNAETRIKLQSKNQALLASKAASSLLQETFKFPEIIANNPLVVDAVRSGSAKAEAENLTKVPVAELEKQFAASKLIYPNQALNDYLKKTLQAGEGAELFITERHGFNIAYAEPTTDFVQNDEIWWKEGKTNQQWVSSPKLNASVEAVTIDLALAIIDPDTEQFLGIIKYALPTSKFDTVIDFLKHTGIEGSQKVQLLDKTGSVINTVTSRGSDSERQVVGGEPVAAVATSLVRAFQDPALSPQETINELKSQYGLDKVSISPFTHQNGDQALIVSFNAKDRAYTIATVPGTEWVAVASLEELEIATAGNELIWVFVFSTLILGGVAVGIILVLARRLSTPLGNLAETAERIASGHLDLQAKPTGTRETQTLAYSFNNLVLQLKSLLRQQANEAKQSRLLAAISNYPATNPEEAEKALEQALQGAREIQELDRMVIYRFHTNGSGYVAHESVGQQWPSALNYQIQESCIPEALRQEYIKGRIVPTDDVYKARFHPDHLKLMERLAIKSNLVAPIITQGQLYGLIIAHHCAHTHKWQEREINFMKQLAAQLSVILDRVAFIKDREEAAKRSERIKEITLKISGALKAEDILEIAVRESRKVLKTDRVVIDSFDGARRGTVIAESVTENWPQALGAEITDPGFINQHIDIYKQAQAKAIPDIYQANLSEFHIRQLEPFAVKAKLVTPILMGGELRGLLIAHQCSGPRNWDKAEIDFLSQVATQIGLALERANLVEQQREAREYLQERALELLKEVDPVSKGDLTIRARVTEDEIGTVAYSYNATIESLQKIVTQVQAAAVRVTDNTNQNQNSVQALSAGALQQRKDIEAALEQIQLMASSIRAVATNAERAETAVRQAARMVEDGDMAMNRTVDGIITIRDTVSETARKVKRLGESSQKISKVVNLISRFAAQTNLLALKTSIEAARAGEEGQGFAVIADEIRSLAAQSAQATAEIEELIAGIQAETNEVVAAMESGTSQVVTGTKLVDETRSSLDKIASASAQINRLVKEIAQAAVEQAQTSEAVTHKMTEVAEIANQTSNEAEQVSDSFKELLAVARALQESVGQFKVAR